MSASLDHWIASRPQNIQEAIRKWPIGNALEMPDGEVLYMLGWAEREGDDGVTLILSPINPAEDYEGASANRRYICSKHVRPFGDRKPSPKAKE